jgi:hypothetical protein
MSGEGGVKRRQDNGSPRRLNNRRTQHWGDGARTEQAAASPRRTVLVWISWLLGGINRGIGGMLRVRRAMLMLVEGCTAVMIVGQTMRGNSAVGEGERQRRPDHAGQVRARESTSRATSHGPGQHPQHAGPCRASQ